MLTHCPVSAEERLCPARLDLHESGKALKKTSTATGFWFFKISLLKIWKDFKVLSRFMQKWIQPPACSNHSLHRILSAGTLLFDEKSAKVLLYFGLDCGMLEFFTHELWSKEQSMSLPHFWSTVRQKRCKPWSKQEGGWIHFCMKRFRTLNSYQIFKIKNKK